MTINPEVSWSRRWTCRTSGHLCRYGLGLKYKKDTTQPVWKYCTVNLPKKWNKKELTYVSTSCQHMVRADLQNESWVYGSSYQLRSNFLKLRRDNINHTISVHPAVCLCWNLTSSAESTYLSCFTAEQIGGPFTWINCYVQIKQFIQHILARTYWFFFLERNKLRGHKNYRENKKKAMLFQNTYPTAFVKSHLDLTLVRRQSTPGPTSSLRRLSTASHMRPETFSPSSPCRPSVTAV